MHCELTNREAHAQRTAQIGQPATHSRRFDRLPLSALHAQSPTLYAHSRNMSLLIYRIPIQVAADEIVTQTGRERQSWCLHRTRRDHDAFASDCPLDRPLLVDGRPHRGGTASAVVHGLNGLCLHQEIAPAGREGLRHRRAVGAVLRVDRPGVADALRATHACGSPEEMFGIDRERYGSRPPAKTTRLFGMDLTRRRPGRASMS